MMLTVHSLGYKFGLQVNVMRFSYHHPKFEELKHFLQYQCRDSANRALNWEHDLDGDNQDDLGFTLNAGIFPILDRICKRANKPPSKGFNSNRSGGAFI